jgi:hypothetical protein
MADIPNGPVPGMSGFDMMPPTPRPIASPFGVFPGLRAPTPPQQPGLNVNPGTPTPAGWLPDGIVSSLVAALTPSKQDVATTLGAPVDFARLGGTQGGLAAAWRRNPALAGAGPMGMDMDPNPSPATRFGRLRDPMIPRAVSAKPGNRIAPDVYDSNGQAALLVTPEMQGWP